MDRTIRLFSAAQAIFFREFRGETILTLVMLVEFDVRRSTFDVRRSTFDVRRSLRPMGRPASPGSASPAMKALPI
ncbi:hypothetical protein [Burkholderia sp. BDU5]|uniref:hypothetical protein n=1 Tax=Burkholderia sp. BDU5 TaxID=1385590 RepID=UPI0012E3750A|nr:hypothetical protein [Burkholderia sp. BDU5]